MKKIYKLSIVSGELAYTQEKIIAYYADRELCLQHKNKLQEELNVFGLDKNRQRYLESQVCMKKEIIEKFGYINYPGAEAVVSGPYDLVE